MIYIWEPLSAFYEEMATSWERLEKSWLHRGAGIWLKRGSTGHSGVVCNLS